MMLKPIANAAGWAQGDDACGTKVGVALIQKQYTQGLEIKHFAVPMSNSKEKSNARFPYF